MRKLFIRFQLLNSWPSHPTVSIRDLSSEKYKEEKIVNRNLNELSTRIIRYKVQEKIGIDTIMKSS